MRGDTHDTAGAVLQQNVVADQHGHFFAVHRVDAIRSRRQADLFYLIGSAVYFAHVAYLAHEFLYLRFVVRTRDQFFHQRVLRRQHHVGNPENSVRAGGENSDHFVMADNFKVYFRALAPPDPVFLHDFDLVGPASQQVNVLEQALRVIGNFKEPLGQLPFFHRGPATLAAPVFHLLVGEHRGAVRTPVYRCLFFIGQPLMEQLEKKPLGPAIVLRVAGGDFPVPVIAYAQLL
ncbi:MAG: hypothetical protein A4E56_03307 [Pelotomaculum sp. PtaU1.Bin065]|nr:MAG: hypothetical protein A4E56_03307 [Pelotomaculum sp. PtaU1.Bin065]